VSDGFDLRLMAELGLVAVSFECHQAKEAAFSLEMEILQNHIGNQLWADTNAVAV